MKSWEGLGSNWHNGIGQGGNKSFCAYRLGFGVPGYTGFVPVSENIAIPVKKASAERAPLDRGHGDHGDGGALTMSKSTTRKDYSLTPANFAIATMPNKLWDNKAPRPVGDPPFIRRPVDDRERPFFARSTFQDAYEEGLAPKPYPENVTQTGHLRPPNVGAPADDRDPFFTSESNLKTTQTAELAAAQLDRHFVPPVAVKQRANPQLRGVGLRHRPPSTTYRDSFGLYGSDPQSKMARTPTGLEGQSMLGSTSLDFQGTTKATLHPPGYVGFIPETGRRARPPSPSSPPPPFHPLRRRPLLLLARRTRSRRSTRWGSSRASRRRTSTSRRSTSTQHVPGYSGYRPIAPINISDPVPNEAATSLGRGNIAGTCGFVPHDLGISMSTLAAKAPPPSVHGIKGQIKLDLFSHEDSMGNRSENGLHEAECYYKGTRPFEGRSVAIIKAPGT